MIYHCVSKLGLQAEVPWSFKLHVHPQNYLFIPPFKRLLKTMTPKITSQDCILNAQKQVVKSVWERRDGEGGGGKAQSRRKYLIYSCLRTAVAKITSWLRDQRLKRTKSSRAARPGGYSQHTAGRNKQYKHPRGH